MTHHDLFLLESCDTAGATPQDAAAKLAALRAAGWNAEAFVLDPRAEPDAGPPARSSLQPRVFRCEASLRAAWRERSSRRAPAVALAAGRHAEAIAPGLAADRERVFSWPVEFAARPATNWPWRKPLPPWNGLPRALEAAADVAAMDALDVAALESNGSRRAALPLWDGNYVLVAAPLDARTRALAIRAFARLAASDGACDLVFLEHPDAASERLVSELGVGIRVHFAGESTHESLRAWIGGACCALFGDGPALSATLIARALAAGLPVLVAGGGPVARARAAALAARGLLAGSGASVPALAGALELALARDAGTNRAIERGRQFAGALAGATLGARLGDRARARGTLVRAA
jgi:hypothetical protein